MSIIPTHKPEVNRALAHEKNADALLDCRFSYARHQIETVVHHLAQIYGPDTAVMAMVDIIEVQVIQHHGDLQAKMYNDAAAWAASSR